MTDVLDADELVHTRERAMRPGSFRAGGSSPQGAGLAATWFRRSSDAHVRTVTLLGGFDLAIGGARSITVPLTVQRLIAFLALRGRTGRSRIAGSLWPESTESRAQANLRTAIWRANKVSPDLVTCGKKSLALGEDVDVDVDRLVRTAHEVMDGRPITTELGQSLWDVDAELLPDWIDECLVMERERLRQLRLHVLETAAEQLAAKGMFGLAMEAALGSLRTDSLRESAHRAVIRVHLAEGNVIEAVQAYRYCSTLFARECGTTPSQETSQLLAGLIPVPPDGPAPSPLNRASVTRRSR